MQLSSSAATSVNFASSVKRGSRIVERFPPKSFFEFREAEPFMELFRVSFIPDADEVKPLRATFFGKLERFPDEKCRSEEFFPLPRRTCYPVVGDGVAEQ